MNARKSSDAFVLLAFVLTFVATLSGARAEPKAGRVARVGFLGATSASGYAHQLEAMRQGFRDLGYVEGQNLSIDYRWAEERYERLPALAGELVRLRPDVIVTHGVPATRALKRATTTIPIVMAVSGEALSTGLIASLARPGGNITGSTFFLPELSAKRLELLKALVPRLRRFAVLLNPDNPINHSVLESMRRTAAPLKVELLELPIRSPDRFEDVFALMASHRADGLIVQDDGMLLANIRRIADLSLARRLPGAGFAEYAEGGGLLAYGVNFSELWRRAPVFVDKILNGVPASMIPVEQATKFELIINRKTAGVLGLTNYDALLMRADRVIE